MSRHERGRRFYPAGTRPREQLRYYSGRFDTVEVNATFYRLAQEGAVREWVAQTPDGFLFACKGSRFITHNKRLKDIGLGLERFFAPLAAFGAKLGPIVFQLPERFKPDAARLAAFIDALPRRHRYAFEFRNPAWFEDAVLAALRERDAALCLYDFAGRQAPPEITAEFVYIRLHGPGGPDTALAAWAERLRAWSRQGRDVYCYFDNDDSGYAPRNALRLKALLCSS